MVKKAKLTTWLLAWQITAVATTLLKNCWDSWVTSIPRSLFLLTAACASVCGVPWKLPNFLVSMFVVYLEEGIFNLELRMGSCVMFILFFACFLLCWQWKGHVGKSFCHWCPYTAWQKNIERKSRFVSIYHKYFWLLAGSIYKRRCYVFCEQVAVFPEPTTFREATCLLLLLYYILNLEYPVAAATTLEFLQRWGTFSAGLALL